MSLTIPTQREVLAQDITPMRVQTPEEQTRDILRRMLRIMQKQNTYTMALLGQKMQILPEWVAEANEELHKMGKELEG
jgi:membrane protein required for beta-lactamase induction